MARDKYHELVKKALVAEGWTITDDPLAVPITPTREVKVDLGAERLIGAEKDSERIAVEIKSFLNASQLHNFYGALGQTIYYKVAMEMARFDRDLFLAVPEPAYESFFQEPVTVEIIRRFDIQLIVYDIKSEKITTWKR